MGKIILHECAYNSVDGKSTDTNALAYSKVTSCLTVTCICSDGTIGGGHVVITPFSLWYVSSNLFSLIAGKTITTVFLIGSSIWNNTNELQALFYQGTNENYYPDSRGGNVTLERYYLADVIANGGGAVGLEAAISAIRGKPVLNFFTGLYGGEMNIEFQGGRDSVTLNINGEEQEIPYVR
ncbi:hypothetical protein SAMN05518672_1011364 [Chitinophaga sp. CF118]|uniref:hypothetical protein n=1 Tax=Chitinophaga sp. CF118 TaxID=1884367 RepID=UPI0008E03AE5|nr:hypothetical protein [Chitinophaga sp. CF118]SFD26776.1 hypothetical protein SAMN05518672_1011364 [Chitinophaga sp. CF118]